MVCFNNFLVGIFFVSIDGSRDASSTPIFLPDVRGESFFVFSSRVCEFHFSVVIVIPPGVRSAFN